MIGRDPPTAADAHPIGRGPQGSQVLAPEVCETTSRSTCDPAASDGKVAVTSVPLGSATSPVATTSPMISCVVFCDPFPQSSRCSR